jgi:chaperonin GroES
MKAFGKNIIVDVTSFFKEEDVKTKAGIIIPGKLANSNTNTIVANVIDVGSKVENIKIGDSVLMLKQFGARLDENDKIYAILTEDLIMAVIDK